MTARYSPLTFLLGLFKPHLAVNGHAVPAGWSRTVVPVSPGQHHVHVHVPYLLPPRIGVAETTVPVHPGQTVELEYRAPMIAFIGGSLGPPPQKYRGMAATIVLLAISLLLALCACGAGIWAALQDDESRDPAALPTGPLVPAEPTSPSDRTTTPDPTGSAPTAPSTGGSEEPTLRQVPARAIVGPTFAAGENTWTMDFRGWPFAFRTPGTWGCMAGEIDLPDARLWQCVDEKNPTPGQKLHVMLRPCPDRCGAAERARLNLEWFDPGAKAKQHDPDTWYYETTTEKGRYALDTSHYFTREAGGVTKHWQVGAAIIAPPDKRAAGQKAINDIFSQTQPS
ncbi:hypothetical protein [Plantactinospora sp. GCM10030261]|uniref:hypothetical protein n=1 Tax=Plantactinospora sp. GCM10030261 TaxID=3273420 RepID=UPI0036178FC8